MVVNPCMNGVVTFEADGRTWRLQASVNALAIIETRIPDPEEVAKLMSGGDASFETVRIAFWAALTDHHPDLTLGDAGRLITHLGQVVAGSKMAQALILAFPGADSTNRPPLAARLKA